MTNLANEITVVDTGKNKIKFDDFNFSNTDFLSNDKIIHFGKLPEYDLRYCVNHYDKFQTEINIPAPNVQQILNPEFITDTDFDFIMSTLEGGNFYGA